MSVVAAERNGAEENVREREEGEGRAVVKPPERFRPAVGEGGEGRDEGDEGGAVW